MANKLEITTQYKDSAWLITSKVTDDSEAEFPRDIFLWTLTTEGALDSFKSIGAIDQVARYPVYSPSRTNNFGIHLVRYDSSQVSVATEADRDKVVTVLKSAFQLLLDGYKAASIPLVEVYP